MAQEVVAPIPLEQEVKAPGPNRLQRMFHLARRHPLGVFGLLCVGLLFGAGLFADIVSPYDPLFQDRETRTVGSLGESVSADDTTFLIINPGTGIGSTIFLGEEQVRLDFPISEIGDESVFEVIRGVNDTVAVDHEAGESFYLDNAVKQRYSPSLDHPFGTDRAGRDVLSRTIWGARISLMIGLVSIFVGVTLGAFFGVLSGYLGGFTDSVIQRGVDILLAFPALVLLLAIITVIGDENSNVRQAIDDLLAPVLSQDGSFWGIPNFVDIFVVSIGIGVAVAVGTARIVRGAVLSLKENVYIEAARSIGASPSRIMRSHILPNVAALIVILGSIFLPIAILAESAISFLGVGVPDPTPSWGADLSEKNREDALQGYWWPAFFPGLALSLVVLGFNLLGDAFRDISDPRLRGGGGGGSSRGGGMSM
jgi:ABC-type dipeptide/oligopeptide/nickel transport system permease subunit